MRTLMVGVYGLSLVASVAVTLGIVHILILALRPNNEQINRLVFDCHRVLSYAVLLFSIVLLGSLISVIIP